MLETFDDDILFHQLMQDILGLPPRCEMQLKSPLTAPGFPRRAVRAAPCTWTSSAFPANWRRTSDTFPYSKTLPWSINTIRSHNSSTRCIWCEHSSTVTPASRCSRNRSLTNWVLTGSSPLKGSSTMSNSGLCSRVAMICAFCCIPLLSSLTFLVAACQVKSLQVTLRPFVHLAGFQPLQ